MKDEGDADSIPPPDAESRAWLNELLTGIVATQLTYVAAKLGIPDLLKDGPMSAAEVAAKTGADARALNEMMRALATLGVFAHEDGRFRVTPHGMLLQTFPGFRSHATIAGEEYFRAFGGFLHTAMTGKPAFDHVFGQTFYDYLAGNAEAAGRFNEATLLSARLRYADVTRAYDFSGVATMVDVGCGYGGLASIILKENPAIRAILMDSTKVLAGARQSMEANGLAHRCEFVAGSFFDFVPRGGDVYIVSSVLSNWDDDRARRILENCGAAMGPEARLVAIEPALADDRPSRNGALFAVSARAIHGSVVRTEAEYSELLKRAGFRLTSFRPLSYEPWTLMTTTRESHR